MLRQFVIWGGIGLLLLVLKVVGPIIWIETSCRADAVRETYQPLITQAALQRDEARSYLTYPEWHIVYAYQEMGKLMETGDEHEFNYLQSITGFWSSLCTLNQESDRHGGSEGMMSTIYTIGASFTLEMGIKALFEETIGRVTAMWRGSTKSPQDEVSAEMMKDYALFLHQTPWYQYDFLVWIDKLWQVPVKDFVRGWERRLTLGTEWMAKVGYAQVIAKAVESVGADELTMRSVVSGLSDAQLNQIEGIKTIGKLGKGIQIETPRYQAFTDLVPLVVNAGGNFDEIAGNDDILVTVTGPADASAFTVEGAKVMTSVMRQGFNNQRLLLNVKVASLATVVAGLKETGFQLEHVHDY